MKTFYFLLFLAFLISCNTENKPIVPIPSNAPNQAQLKQIARQYGMFIHFSINTFNDIPWSDGSLPASSYNPTTVDAEQWVKTAKDAGMNYIILISKHHDGFCLWDSAYTDYDVASSGNGTNVIEEVAKACKKFDIELGLYYSLWDRKENGNAYINGENTVPYTYVKDSVADQKYNRFMINQLNELIDITQPYTDVVEFWFDGGWTKEHNRWPLNDIYQTIKSRVPECQIGVNWSIGLPENIDYHAVYPEDQKEGYPIRYFPSDFRLGDPMLPANPDPKLFTHKGKTYYMPWESTVCLSERWFYNTTDSTYKSIAQLTDLYQKATAQNNILILNAPPNREGKIRAKDQEILLELKGQIDSLEGSL
ncbi:alpha-L-fucosidase [Leeuwenhoekiella palythoae]|uniref:alpha-L-fucosidase n=1 Tax=Leeuwenhoekiella palythoae TaxID=573501 RepID=A0A1M5XQ02_9FLAO|nr:alpha-L-fucosidase [Leeuwenhoekiella palythoae]RXG30167.1 alpha-L-fucosidase [Leeuwenhoekiella palythoae]SHI01598.1 alpha-L-fucosidase [Leeuwenhoekiella palythoae]